MTYIITFYSNDIIWLAVGSQLTQYMVHRHHDNVSPEKTSWSPFVLDYTFQILDGGRRYSIVIRHSGNDANSSDKFTDCQQLLGIRDYRDIIYEIIDNP